VHSLTSSLLDWRSYEYTKLQRSLTDPDVQEDADELEPSPTMAGLAALAKSRSTNPRLTEERLRRLETIGFEWKVKHKMKRYYDKQWEHMFERLLKYKEVHGHCGVPKRCPADMKLGTWVHTQRIQYVALARGT
jgi:Helicase associated domain